MKKLAIGLVVDDRKYQHACYVIEEMLKQHVTVDYDFIPLTDKSAYSNMTNPHPNLVVVDDWNLGRERYFRFCDLKSELLDYTKDKYEKLLIVDGDLIINGNVDHLLDIDDDMHVKGHVHDVREHEDKPWLPFTHYTSGYFIIYNLKHFRNVNHKSRYLSMLPDTRVNKILVDEYYTSVITPSDKMARIESGIIEVWVKDCIKLIQSHEDRELQHTLNRVLKQFLEIRQGVPIIHLMDKPWSINEKTIAPYHLYFKYVKAVKDKVSIDFYNTCRDATVYVMSNNEIIKHYRNS